ncbi:GvpL/GvpF family gas vesicle protein [Sphaerisporangium perillae]|uniref:GvpL/GvpF family gas vesicle protein n=1 Tax=Sphaerisporangium perillae TaxID=2935860 RepID=UPI00200E95A0|nr:GvpL/GvpF family gas vesicle protein [Sphaerisporangium perillae]
MADTGTYLYAVTRQEDRADPAALSGLEGVTGAPVRAITHAGLVAYVSTVPLEEFGEEPLRRSLEDLDWVGETARAHHRVVEAVAETAATAPVRLVTVYSGDDQVRDMLDRRRGEFAAILAQVAGRREWGVKAYADRPAAPAASGTAHPTPTSKTSPTSGTAGTSATSETAGTPATSGTSGTAGTSATSGTSAVSETSGGLAGREPPSTKPGTEYLRRRKASLRSRDQAWREAAERAERIHAALADVAVASTRHRPQDPQLSGREEWMLLNGAYLVDEERREEFAATLEALRGPGVQLELTGPWAPYSFTALEAAGAAPEDRDGP